MTQSNVGVVTVGDSVRLTKDLMGTVRFVGEIQGRKGIYYGIELTEAKGKSNGTVGNTRYFKCKSKRGLFLRFARIQEVIPNKNIHRIGINDHIEINNGNRKLNGIIRYIGIPPRCKDIYYGIQFKKPIGDNDGIFHNTRYFTTNKKCAYFIKVTSNNIKKVAADNTKTKTKILDTKTKTKTKTKTTIELDIYCSTSDDVDIDQPIFQITISSSFTYNDLISSISKMSQYISTVFSIRFDSNNNNKHNGHSNGHSNGHNNHVNNHIHSYQNSILTKESFSLLRSHNSKFYEYGKFYVIELLKKGIKYEESSLYTDALKVYLSAVTNNKLSTEALTYYGNCLVLLDKFDLAEEIYKKALDINPFCGDICYFYSRLLEYRDKYDEAKNLCNRIMSYVKKSKSIKPKLHHPIHYSCYARLSQKYITLSLDRYKRSKINTKKKLDQYIREKAELQIKIDKNIQNNISNPSYAQLIKNINDLNNKIVKLEEQLIKKENIIKEKDKKLNNNKNDINLLKNELNLIKNNNKNVSISKSKVISDKIIKDNKITLKKIKIKKQIVAVATAGAGAGAGAGGAVDDDNKDNNNNNNNIDILSEYMPLFNKLSLKKSTFEASRKVLLNELLTVSSSTSTLSASASLADIIDQSGRQLLMKSKLKLCGVICIFNTTDASELTRIENKKDLLLEVLQCMSNNKWNNIDLLSECINVININLFRSLPDSNNIATDINDDEMDFRDPSWDHLQLIYELTFHVVTNTSIDKKTMKKYLSGQFIENLINLFSSSDDREPQYVKIIVHAIYGRFMALRKSIRRHLSNYCYKYIYKSVGSSIINEWQGLPEILEIFCSIFQGLNIPVKPDYHIVLRNVIIPLHKSFHLDEFHEQLLQCCTQFVTKDPYSANVILGGILKFWPKFSPLKEQLFITEIVHILNVCIRHPNIKQSDPSFATITIAVLNKFINCMTSPHHQVAERSLMVWRDETIRICVDLHREKIWPNIYKALSYNKEKYWLSAIRNINRQIMSDFKRRDPEFFEKIEKQQQSSLLSSSSNNNNNNNNKIKQREKRWLKLRELANKKSNKK